MARQVSGWSLAHGEDRVTFKCEGCGVRLAPMRRYHIYDISDYLETFMVCSLGCFRRAERLERARERDGQLHMLVCDAYGCSRCDGVML
jgi:hypothetical protein